MDPRVGIGVIVEKDGKLLLGRRIGSHGADTWSIPGGHLEFGEKVEACARRELLEETGLRAVSCTLGPWSEDVLVAEGKHYINIFVIVDQFEGEPQALEPEKCEGWLWFPWDALPAPLFQPFETYLRQYKKLPIIE